MELQTPPIGTPPRRVGVAPPTVGPSNGRRPGNRAMGPTNQEASGQEKKPLPPKKKYASGCRDERGETEIVAIAVCSLGSGNAKVVGSRPTVEVRVGVTAHGGTGTPARLY